MDVGFKKTVWTVLILLIVGSLLSTVVMWVGKDTMVRMDYRVRNLEQRIEQLEKGKE